MTGRRDIVYWEATALKEQRRADVMTREAAEAKLSLQHVVKETVKLHQRIEELEAALGQANAELGWRRPLNDSGIAITFGGRKSSRLPLKKEA